MAAENYDRLKNITSWCQVIGMHYIVDRTGKDFGHAVVAYKYEPDGHIFITDASGTFDLDTSDGDLESIRIAWQRKMPKGVTLRYFKLLAAPTPTASPWKSTATITEDDIAPDRGLQPSKDTPELPDSNNSYSAPAPTAATNNTSATGGIIIFALVFVLAIARYARATEIHNRRPQRRW